MATPQGPEHPSVSPARAAGDAAERSAPLLPGSSTSGPMPATPDVSRGGARIVAAFAARGMPDLASCIRRDVERAGVVIEELGIGSAGEHVVVTVLVPAAARAMLQRLAERARVDLSFLSSTDENHES